ncbi:uncharacterized protein LOC144053186 [Vanacampus margaritifer]
MWDTKSRFKAQSAFAVGRNSQEAEEVDKQRLLHQHLCLETDVSELKKKLQTQKEEHQRQDAQRVRNIEEVKAEALHWKQKWQHVAVTLQSAFKELDDLKKTNLVVDRRSLHQGSVLMPVYEEDEENAENAPVGTNLLNKNLHH